jgi:hypothetical protein
MSIFINTNTNEYPRHIGDIQILYPYHKGEDFLPDGWHLVEPTAHPTITSEQTVEESFPVNIDGKWKQSWVVRDLTDSEAQEKERLFLEDQKRLNPSTEEEG